MVTEDNSGIGGMKTRMKDNFSKDNALEKGICNKSEASKKKKNEI